ncbi:hypothetical protein HWV62_4918 [Athelia sp. TMB]|nr:hypothetical protein HWV62_4918 [Athelia sp. TMB]
MPTIYGLRTARRYRLKNIFKDHAIYDNLFCFLGPEDLAAIACTATIGRNTVQHFHLIAFNIDKHLLPYLPYPSSFRSLQQRTGTLIAGSHALRFFLRISDADTDLNIYVNRGHGLEICLHLLEIQGYTFEPWGEESEGSPQHFPANENDGRSWDEDGTVIRVEDEPMYSKRAVHAIFSFGKQCADGRYDTITVTVAAHSAFHVILNMHSTCIMNIITSHFAISLYPKATFLSHATIPLNYGTTTPPELLETERDKYSDRGFNYYHSLSINDTITLCDSGSVRTVGDSLCWTIQLSTRTLEAPSHFTRSSASGPQDFIRANSWRMVAAGNWTMMQYSIVSLSSYRYSYVTVQPQDARAMVSFHLQRLFLRANNTSLPLVDTWRWDSALIAILNGELQDIGSASTTTWGRIGRLLFPSQHIDSASSQSTSLDYPALMESRTGAPWDDGIVVFSDDIPPERLLLMLRAGEYRWNANAYAGLHNIDFDVASWPYND